MGRGAAADSAAAPIDGEYRAAAAAAVELLERHAAFLGEIWTVEQADEDLRRCSTRSPQRFVDAYVAEDNAARLAAALRANRPMSSDQHRERLRQNWRTSRAS